MEFPEQARRTAAALADIACEISGDARERKALAGDALLLLLVGRQNLDAPRPVLRRALAEADLNRRLGATAQSSAAHPRATGTPSRNHNTAPAPRAPSTR